MTIKSSGEIRPNGRMAHRFGECVARKLLAAKAEDNRPPSHLGHSVVGCTKNTNICTVAKFAKCFKNRMERIAVFKGDKTGNILNKNRARLKRIDKTKIFLEKVIALIERTANRCVN